MKVFIAAGMSIIAVRGREVEIQEKLDHFPRLLSFAYWSMTDHFRTFSDETLQLVKETKENESCK